MAQITWIGRQRLGPGSEPAAVAQTACTAVTLPLALGLLVLLFWNGFLAANNRTTIEYHEGVRANVQVRPSVSARNSKRVTFAGKHQGD